MSDVTATAQELYRTHGLKKANFIAFDKMQKAKDLEETDFWLHVINQITVLDMGHLRSFDDRKEGEGA